MRKQGKQNTNSKDFRTAPARATFLSLQDTTGHDSTRSACTYPARAPCGRSTRPAGRSAHYFRTVWKVKAGGVIKFNTYGLYTVDWGDGCTEQVNIEQVKVKGKDKQLKHIYVKKGEYTVAISPGVTRFCLSRDTAHKLIEIKQWGRAQWETMAWMFAGARSMICTATDAPDLSKVEAMGFVFFGCEKFNSPIEHWDTKRVKHMSDMLAGALMFNRSLANMDLSSVQYVNGMLHNTPAFDQDLRGLKVGAKVDTDKLFGWDKSLEQYNEEHGERFDAQNEKEKIENVLCTDTSGAGAVSTSGAGAVSTSGATQ